MIDTVSVRHPRTLILSANALSTQSNNGKMLSSFFREYDKSELAQIYTYPEYPNQEKCDCYFRITDMDMLKSKLSRTPPGSVVHNRYEQEDDSKASIYKSRVTQWPVFRLMRELAWCGSKWKSKELLAWLDEFSPQVLFFSGINSPALYRIARFIIDRYHIPVIVYATDDYFLPRFSFSPSFHIRRKWLNSSMKGLLHGHHRSELLVVNEYMKEAYLKQFNKNSTVILHQIDVPVDSPIGCSCNDPITVSYIGNLLNNRSSTLEKMASNILTYTKKDKFRFEIYTRQKPDDKMLQKITCSPFVNFCGALNADEVKEKLKTSDVLFHVESFHYQNRKDTLLSLSTKITECMAAAKPILMIGPEEIGTVRFLAENTQNICVTSISEKELHEALDRLLEQKTRTEIGAKNYDYIKMLMADNQNGDIVAKVSAKLLGK